MHDARETKDLSGAEKRALPERLLVEKASRVKTSHPLSQGQQALWFLHQDAPESPAYNVAAVFRILSPVDVAALRAVFETLIARHACLRSTFSHQDGQPVQVVHGHQALCFEEIDASMDTEEELKRRVTAAHRRPFDPEQGPLLRVSLFTRAPQDHVLLIAIHHIVTDGWSVWMLLSELLLLYPFQKVGAQKSGQAATLPPLQWQYQDFVRWQTELIASKAGERLWEYWQEQLSGELPVLELPTDRPRPPVQSYAGASIFFRLPEPLTQKLKGQAQAAGATPYMILLAAFQILLHRYTGQDDILVGSPTRGRSRDEFDGICGYFVNPIVLRARLKGNPSFAFFLDQVRRTVLEGLAHQDYPFPLLVQRLQPARDTSHSPIFQTLFALQKAQKDKDDELPALLGAGDEGFRVTKNGLLLAPFRMAQQEGQFDLTLQMIETQQSLFGAFQYSTDLFEAATVERMAGHFQRLLEGIVAAPETKISRLPLLTEAEQERILVEWNDTKAPYPADKCIHELFEEQVMQSPDAVALVFERQEISYRELNARANRLAHRLRVLGVGPETLVGLLVERSVAMIVGLLAILKAGGAYVPLDPEYPAERLAFMTEDAELKVLLCHGATRERLPECSARILDLDADAATIADESSANLARFASVDNLAYVIYTSGSTGKPKGVMVRHRNLSAMLYGFERLAPSGKSLIGTSVCPFSFDVSVWELFSNLCFGGTLHILRQEYFANPEYFSSYLMENRITCTYIPPALLSDLVAQLEKQSGPIALNRILVGVEPIKEGILQRFRCISEDMFIINGYGPTETTICATLFSFKEVLDPERRTPIGTAVPNYQIYLTDSNLQPVPIGVSGELCIGGAGVARGYLNRSDLTAERFIPDPFNDGPDARLYRTGDLCRWLPDGNIEFLGRMDDQVKLRGFRIELGEIEAVLTRHPAVRQSVVIVWEPNPGDKRLIAYSVADTQPPPTPDELRRFLGEKLPDYMVPTRFVLLEAMPLTPNGKIDRRRLPTPDPFQRDVDQPFTAPGTSLEKTLAAIWSDILERETIGIHDNFFDLGGHSLSAVSLVARIEQQLGRQLPLAALFQGPTIAALARLIEPAAEATKQWSPLVAIRAQGTKRPFFCLPGAGGNVLYFHELAHHLGLDRPFYGLQAVGLEGETAPDIRVEDIAARSIREIRTVQEQGPYLLGGHSFGADVALEMSRQLQREGRKVARLCIFDSTIPLDQPLGLDWDEAQWTMEVAHFIEHLLDKKLALSLADFQLLDSAAQLDLLHETLETNEWAISKRQLYGLIRTYKANCQTSYVPRDIPPVPISLFIAEDMLTATASGIEMERLRAPLKQQADWGWGRYADSPVDIHVVSGDHLTMMTRPHVQVLAAKLGTCLDRME